MSEETRDVDVLIIGAGAAVDLTANTDITRSAGTEAAFLAEFRTAARAVAKPMFEDFVTHELPWRACRLTTMFPIVAGPEPVFVTVI